jgi:hypothetical protein
MSGQHGAGEIIETPTAGSATIALPLWLHPIMTAADYRLAVAAGTAGSVASLWRLT